MDLLCTKSATELAEFIRSKKVSSKEVIEAHLARIEEVNPQVNAVTMILNESALIEAEKADASSEEERNRPLHGVPFTVKENIDLMLFFLIYRKVHQKYQIMYFLKPLAPFYLYLFLSQLHHTYHPFLILFHFYLLTYIAVYFFL